MKLPSYNDKVFDEQPLKCSSCQWTGKGYETVLIDFYGVTDKQEAHCPECDTKIALVEKDKGGTPGESASDLSFQFG